MKTSVYLRKSSRAGLMAAMLFPVLIGLASCQKDKSYGSYLTLGSNDEESLYIKLDTLGTDRTTDRNKNAEYWIWHNIHSDIPSWNIVTEYDIDEDIDWVEVWPKSGKGDGRFRIRIGRNDNTPYIRTARIHIMVPGKDEPLKTIEVEQDATSAWLELGMEGMTRLSFGSAANRKEAILSTNVRWIVEMEYIDGSGWLHLEDATRFTQGMTVDQNTGTTERRAKLIFTEEGNMPGLRAELTVVQRDSSTDAENATKTTIGDILNQVGSNGGDIQGNVYIEGYVVSDLSTRNFDVRRKWPVNIIQSGFDFRTDWEKRYMWVMDDSRKGMMFEFASDSYNAYALNDKVKMHLIGYTVVKDSWSGALKIGGLDGDVVFASEASQGIEPIVLNSVADIADYENCLVKIEGVQFAIPYGTLYNVNENQDLFQNSQFTGNNEINAVPWCETSRQYTHKIMDGQGNFTNLITECTFMERYLKLIPHGSGSITAIVTRDALSFNPDPGRIALRIRSDSDIQVSDEESTRFTKPVVHFGPYKNEGQSMLPNITADIGRGTLRHSVYGGLTPASGNDDGSFYFSSSYARIIPSPIVIDPVTGFQRPEIGQEDFSNLYDISYACLNSGSWWKDGKSTMIGTDSEGWIIIISTLGVTGDLYLTFNSSSSQAGPARMRLQWHEDPLAPMDQWRTLIETYDLPNWNLNYHLRQYALKLPDEMKNKNSVIIRHITYENYRAAHTGATLNGTNRIGYWMLEEMK